MTDLTHSATFGPTRGVRVLQITMATLASVVAGIVVVIWSGAGKMEFGDRGGLIKVTEYWLQLVKG